jgi:hypothetical protein
LGEPPGSKWWLAAARVPRTTKDFGVKNQIRVSHPNTVLVGFKLCELAHVDAIPPTEPNDFPKVVIGRKTIKINEQVSNFPMILSDA